MSELTLLDGGMGQELVARAGKATGLWSVQALLDTPDMVRAVHEFLQFRYRFFERWILQLYSTVKTNTVVLAQHVHVHVVAQNTQNTCE